jgi:WD40 repeat protein
MRRTSIALGIIAVSIAIAGSVSTRADDDGARYRPRRQVAADEASWSTGSVAFRVEETRLIVTLEGDDVTLEVPEQLRNSVSYRVALNDDQSLLSLITERGMAVWNTNAPYQQRHLWPANAEPLAGRQVGENVNGDFRYITHELDMAFTLSPDGSRVCVHATHQNASQFDDPTEGLVILRDVATGDEVRRFVHVDWGRVVDKVVWSPDGNRIASFSSYNRLSKYVIRVWDVETREQVSEMEGIFAQFRFSEDGSRLFTLTERYPAVLQVFDADDGELIASRQQATMRSFHISPDGTSLVVVKAPSGLFAGNRDCIELLDADTLEPRWSATVRGAAGLIAFRSDNGEIAATWFVPNEFFGSEGGVMAFDASDGDVVLDDRELLTPGGLYYREDGSLQAGEFVYERRQSE